MNSKQRRTKKRKALKDVFKKSLKPDQSTTNTKTQTK